MMMARSLGIRRFAVSVLVCCTPVLTQGAQDSAERKPEPTQPPSAPVSGKPDTDENASREERFKQLLSGTTLSGTWQMTTFDDSKQIAPLTDPRPETYTISEVSKASDDHWVITARIQYADQDVNVPVLVRVIWSGDTPIITVDNFTVPMIGPYSARVMVYRGFYAGTWFGKGYGGVLSGRISKSQDKDVKKDAVDPKKDSAPQRDDAPKSTDRVDKE